MTRKTLWLAGLTGALALSLTFPSSAQIAVPNTLAARTVIRAVDLNTNFQTLATHALDRLSGGRLQGNVTVDSGITIDGVDVGQQACTTCTPTFGAVTTTAALTVGTTATAAAQPRALVLHSAAQNLTTSTWTAANFDTEDTDIGALHSTVTNPSQLTVPTTGLYLLTAQIYFTANATGSRQIRFLKGNGSTDIGGGTIAAGTAQPTMLSTSTLAQLTAGDILEVYAWQDSGGTLAMGSGTAYQKNRFQAVKLW